jgi:hypothetical protein
MSNNIFGKIIRMIMAAICKVPFRKRVWYNYRAMLPSDHLAGKNFVEIFDENGHYIDCPGVGGTLVYNVNGVRYLYLVIDFKNESRNRDWLYDTDYINPVIEFVRPLRKH